MSNNLIDPCAFHSLEVFGDTPDKKISAEDARRILATQRALVRDHLRGNENDLIAFNGPLTHVANVGLLVLRANLSVGDLTLQNPQVNAKLVPFEPSLDSNDMLHGASRWEEPFGMCFMIGDETILTARHNFLGPECHPLMEGFAYAVFGHSVLADGEPRRTFTVNKDVFRIVPPTSIHFEIPPETDWIKLKLVDPDGVMSRRSATETIALSEIGGDVYTLGHPAGLTLRYSRSMSIAKGSSGTTFRAFLDAYPISSGSPVFDSATHKLAGIVRSGRIDSGLGRVIGEDRRVSLVCAAGGDVEATLCVASDAIT